MSGWQILSPRRGIWLAGMLAAAGLGIPSLRAAEDPVDDRIWVESSVNGQPARLAFDTGAEAVILFRASAQRLGVKYSVPPADAKAPPGQVVMGYSDLIELRLWGTTVTTKVLVYDLPQVMKPGMDGVVGWEPVRENIFAYNGTTGRGSILPAVPAPALGWQKFSISGNYHTLHLSPMDGPSPAPVFLVDTGADTGVVLAPAPWREWRAAHPEAPTTMDAYFMPSAGLVIREICWAQELKVGGVSFTGVPVQEANESEVIMGGPGFVASLGLMAVLRLNVVLDGKGGFAYIDPLKTPGHSIQHNRLGAVFAPKDLQSDPLIAHVVPGSPAFAAGIRDGDYLLKIGELDATQWKTDPAVLPLARFWQRPVGTKLELTLSRDGKVYQASPVLQDILGPGAGATKSGPAPAAGK